nr:hypothetical protein [Saprospiraceae bacterium]
MKDFEILNKTFGKVKKEIYGSSCGKRAVVDFKTPGELRKIMKLAVEERGVNEKQFLQLIDDYLQYSVRTGNKQFFNQLFSGFNLPAFIGELLTTLTNTSMYTYEVAPVASVIEKEMIALMNSYVPFSNGDGIFLTGGSNGNLLAMFSARNRVFPEGRFEGYDRTQKLVAFVNEQAHYSLDTAANLLGIGSKNVIRVKSDSKGRMDPVELESEIKQSLHRGENPFFVVATCATTLMGAYDPMEEMAVICKKYDLWLHADGSFGGSILLSDTHRQLMKGVEKADSLVWNPHKLMNIPLVCSALLLKEKGVLERNLTDMNTDYLYHDTDSMEDLGKKSIQCGRRVDAVKLWFAWKYFGKEGYRERIDSLMAMAEYAEKMVVENPNLQLVVPRQSFAICFRWVPDFKVDLNEFNLEVRERLRKNGSSMVNYGYINDKLVIRLITANGNLQKKDIDEFFHNFTTEAMQLEAKNLVCGEASK